ncbi:MAG TPA: 1-acyl-sn-glycerol-3-phosphate acyltransferase [Thermoanaerobaculia bacterium]|nr:1-acyl-sn-glycerol-3-phosphate acyltransferase [Thermoanaerobaculia bacterium]
MRAYLVFLILFVAKVIARIFYRIEMRFIGDVPPKPWAHHRVVAILNHTSLFEWVFAGGCPNTFLWRMARHGVIPVARKTADRPLVGRFYSLVAARVIPITRERDETWDELLRQIHLDAMVLLLPEGRMKRATGLDADGKPMTVRGGIADILEAVGEGRMLLAYSGGLHHIQTPGEKIPRLFKKVRMNLEVVDIAPYNAARLAETRGDRRLFKRAVANDLERRRDLNCPVEPGTAASPPAPAS